MKNPVVFGVIAIAAALCGCDTSVQNAISLYQQEAGQIKIGMDKQEVLAILEQTQAELRADERRPPEQFADDNGAVTEVYFFRSQAFYDDMLTDDEFTPYVFKNDKLTAIGWTALGGPKTQGLPYPRTQYHMGVGYGYHRW